MNVVDSSGWLEYFAGCRHAYREASDQAAIAALDATGRPFAPVLLRVAIGQSEYCLL